MIYVNHVIIIKNINVRILFFIFKVFQKKGQYNQLLDQRIIELYQLYNTQYQVLELCQIFYRHHELIAKVWKEEDDQQVEKRRDFFVKV